MIDTLQIYQDLAETLGQPAAQKLAALLGAMYRDILQTVTKEDFRELKQAVADLAEAQKRTEQRVDSLTQRVEELAEAQMRTEQRVEELAQAQKHTEEAMAAGFRDIDRRLGLLVDGFRSLDRRLDLLDRRFGVLGARWGDGAEEAFRQGLLEMVRDLGYTVEPYQGQDPEGFIDHSPRSFDLDVLVRDGDVVLAEIKSNASGADVTEFHRCVQLYERQTARRATKRVLVAVTIQSQALERARELEVIVATNFQALAPTASEEP